MEPKKDFVLVRDGKDATAQELATLSGRREENPQFVRSTGNYLYVYTRTDQADSRAGYRYKSDINIMDFRLDMNHNEELNHEKNTHRR